MAAITRINLSNKERFAIFMRDRFTCQYCGAHGDGVVLHVDHIDPVANGGESCEGNLITACQRCNSGKGAQIIIHSKTTKDHAQKEKRISKKDALIKEMAFHLEWLLCFANGGPVDDSKYLSAILALEKATSLNYGGLREGYELWG